MSAKPSWEHSRRYVRNRLKGRACASVLGPRFNLLGKNVGLGGQDWPGQTDVTPELDADDFVKFVIVGINKSDNRPWHHARACARNQSGASRQISYSDTSNSLSSVNSSRPCSRSATITPLCPPTCSNFKCLGNTVTENVRFGILIVTFDVFLYPYRNLAQARGAARYQPAQRRLNRCVLVRSRQPGRTPRPTRSSTCPQSQKISSQRQHTDSHQQQQ